MTNGLRDTQHRIQRGAPPAPMRTSAGRYQGRIYFLVVPVTSTS